MRLALASCLALLTQIGCGAAELDHAAPAVERSIAERYFPASEGSVWSYDVDTGEELKSLVIARVVMRQGAYFAISNSGSEPIFYELRDDGVYHLESASYLFKLPFEVGASWSSRGGLARVVEANVSVEQGGARYAPCAIIEETRPGSGAAVRTSYCEDIGVVRIETSLEGAPHPRPTVATLRGYEIAD